MNKKRTRVIAGCMPGENFHFLWMSNWFRMVAKLLVNGYGFVDCWGHTSNVYVTRNMIHEDVMKDLIHYDFVLWMDDDNPPTWDQVKLLIEDLDKYPDISMVAGWSYIQSAYADLSQEPPVRSSVGHWVDNEWVNFPIEDLENATGLVTDDDLVSGFPVVLIRQSAMCLVPRNPFIPILNKDFTWGVSGEDVAFCIAMREGGGNVFVDPRVRIEHLKMRPIRPPKTNLPEVGHFEMKGADAA